VKNYLGSLLVHAIEQRYKFIFCLASSSPKEGVLWIYIALTVYFNFILTRMSTAYYIEKNYVSYVKYKVRWKQEPREFRFVFVM
jgi:hypothetical protein